MLDFQARANILYQLYPLCVTIAWLKKINSSLDDRKKQILATSVDLLATIYSEISNEILHHSIDNSQVSYLCLVNSIECIEDLAKIKIQQEVSKDGNSRQIAFSSSSLARIEDLKSSIAPIIRNLKSLQDIPPYPDYVDSQPQLTLNRELLSEMPPSENLDTMLEDIRVNGLKERLLCWEEKDELIIIDGCDRYFSCLQSGLPYADKIEIVRYQDLDLAIEERININLNRKHFSKIQIQYLIGRIYSLKVKHGKKQDICRRLQQKYSVSRATVFVYYRYYLACKQIEIVLNQFWQDKPELVFVEKFIKLLLAGSIQHSQNKLFVFSELEPPEMAQGVERTLGSLRLIIPQKIKFEVGMLVVVRASLDNPLSSYNGAIATIQEIKNNHCYLLLDNGEIIESSLKEIVLYRQKVDIPQFRYAPSSLDKKREEKYDSETDFIRNLKLKEKSATYNLSNRSTEEINFNTLQDLVERSVAHLSDREIDILVDTLKKGKKKDPARGRFK